MRVMRMSGEGTTAAERERERGGERVRSTVNVQ